MRTFNLLKYLSQRHSITLATQHQKDVTPAEIEELRQYVTELAVFLRPATPIFPQTGNLVAGIKRRWGKFSRFSQFLRTGTPPHVFSTYSIAMQQWVDAWIQAGNCEVITCEHSINEIYVRPEWQQQVRTVVNVHSSVYGTCRQLLATGTSENPLRDRLNLPLLHRYEQRYCAKFSRIVVTTEEDRRQLQALLSATQQQRRNSLVVSQLLPSTSEPTTRFPIDVIPNGVDLVAFPARSLDPGGHRLIFAGAMDNLPNIDAVRFLSLEVLPVLQQRYADTTLTLVGANPTPEIQALASRPGIQVTGRVPRVVDYLHQATVCVIPMRIGFGIKNKTLEAMAAGTPVVASDRALEGLAVDSPGQPLQALRANLIQEYVEAISYLFESESLRQELSRNARSLIESEYTWDVQGKRYETILLH